METYSPLYGIFYIVLDKIHTMRINSFCAEQNLYGMKFFPLRQKKNLHDREYILLC